MYFLPHYLKTNRYCLALVDDLCFYFHQNYTGVYYSQIGPIGPRGIQLNSVLIGSLYFALTLNLLHSLFLSADQTLLSRSATNFPIKNCMLILCIIVDVFFITEIHVIALVLCVIIHDDNF